MSAQEMDEGCLSALPAPGAGGESGLAALYGELCDAGWSVRRLASLLPSLLRHADELEPERRTAWLAGLHEAWRQGWGLAERELTQLMALASRWSDWPLVVAAGRLLESRGESRGESREPLPLDLAQTVVQGCRQIGETREALARCRRLMLEHPRENALAGLYRELEAWARFSDAAASPVPGETLYLEPLGHHHVGDFARQYYDPAIAELCCLPSFETDAQWHRWLDECWAWGDQRLYAVLHPEWGFVGGVSLILHGGVGFFYYWVGSDFQGHGIGPAAARLLLDDAREHHGMEACYAKVFDYNTPSRRALEKLGFELLDFRPAPPDGDELFYRLGPPQGRERSVAQLRALFADMGSDTRVAVPLAVFDHGGERP